MKYLYIICLSFIIGSMMIVPYASAWYESDESNDNKNNYYANSDWEDTAFIYSYLNGDFFTDSDILIQNLEPGHYVVYDPDHPMLIKYTTLGILEWLEISDLGSSSIYATQLCVDDEYDIYINTASGVHKIDGANGNLLWTFDDMTGADSIYKMKISLNSEYLLVYSGTNSYTAILDTTSGAILNENIKVIENVNDWEWTYNNKLIAIDISGISLYGTDLIEDEEIENSGSYTILNINHVQNNEGFKINNTDYIYAAAGGMLKCYAFWNNTIIDLWSYDHSTLGNIVTNIIHNEKANHVYFGLADGTPSSAVPLQIICLAFDEVNDWTNESIIWTGAAVTGTHSTQGTIICDLEGDVILCRYGSQTMYLYYNTSGVLKQSLTMTFEAWKGPIYDNENDKIIISQRGASNNTCILQYFTYNSTYVQGDNENIPIFPTEISEDNWSWIYYTVMSFAISAIAAFTRNGANGMMFLSAMSINMFIGAWYDIYPIELMFVPIAIMIIIVFKSYGGAGENE